MVMDYSLRYHPDVFTDLSNIPTNKKARIQYFVSTKLRMAPDLFGIPLRRSISGHRKARIGEYRVVFRIQKNILLISAIQHYSAIK